MNVVKFIKGDADDLVGDYKSSHLDNLQKVLEMALEFLLSFV